MTQPARNETFTDLFQLFKGDVGRKTLFRLFLSPQGRITRLQFLAAAIVVLVFGFLIFGQGRNGQNDPNLFFAAIQIYLTFCIYTKRFHDLDKSAWQVGGLFAISTVLYFITGWAAGQAVAGLFYGRASGPWSTVATVFGLSVPALWIYVTARLYMKENSHLPNRFGAPPLQLSDLAVSPDFQAPPGTKAESRADALRSAEARELWNEVKDSNDRGMLSVVIDRYPDSDYAALAQKKIEALSKAPGTDA